VVVGVSTYLFFAPLGLADSYLGLILVHAALGAPFVLTTVLATLQGFNHNLVRASLSLGADPVTTFFRVTLPVIAPGVISGARFGPRQMRAESALLRPYNMATGAAPFDTLQVADLGDVPINTYSIDKSLPIIEAFYDRVLAAGCKPLTLGGDHTIALPILRAM